jgi:RNA polymerase sigma-70 factor (ECF subfamily)
MDLLEKTIINNLKAGDEKAFEFIYKSYFQSLLNYAQTLLRSNYRAEEIILDVFLKLWENRQQCNIESSLKFYLFKTVYNCCLNQIRQFKTEDKYKSYFLNYHSVGYSSGFEYPMEKLIQNELEAKISSIIESLPEQCKTIFLLSRDEGFTHEEIALRMGVSVNTVHTQIARALKKFKEGLKDYLPLFILLLTKTTKFPF